MVRGYSPLSRTYTSLRSLDEPFGIYKVVCLRQATCYGFSGTSGTYRYISCSDSEYTTENSTCTTLTDPNRYHDMCEAKDIRLSSMDPAKWLNGPEAVAHVWNDSVTCCVIYLHCHVCTPFFVTKACHMTLNAISSLGK
jgi:hypothetical protein